MTIQTEANEAAPDYSSLPATAFPEGADPSTYKDSLTAPETSDKAERPAHVPEKFWDAETGTVRADDLAKSYAELEAKLRAPKPEEDAPKADSLKIEKAEGEAQDSEQTNPLTTAFETFANVYQETKGQPPEEAIAEIVKLGVPANIVANYLAGLEALSRESFSKAYTVAGGEEAFNAATHWASQNLSDEEIDSYNTLVSNQTTATQGVEWLMAKYKSATPTEGSFIQAEAGAAVGDVFRSKAEMVTAMKSDRYLNDRAYQREVAEKAARSKQAGTI